jgi:hypothetical protein
MAGVAFGKRVKEREPSRPALTRGLTREREMDEKLREALNGLALKSIDGVQKAVEQIQMNAPGLLEEFLRWKMAWHSVWFGAGILLSLFSLILWILFISKKWFKIIDDGDVAVEFFVIMAAPGFFGLCIIFNNLQWIQILVAPRVYLIEYAMRLVGSK